MIDVGVVQDYKDQYNPGKKGFGFISRTICPSNGQGGNIFFHISVVKRKYPALAHRLNEGQYYEQRFWYITETTEKGEQVYEVWREADEIPIIFKRELLEYLKSAWLDIKFTIPPWLDEVTIEIGGQELRDHLGVERDHIIQKQRAAEAAKIRLEEEKKRIQETELKAKLMADAEEKRRREAEKQKRFLAEEELRQKRNAEIRAQVQAKEEERRRREAEYQTQARSRGEERQRLRAEVYTRVQVQAKNREYRETQHVARIRNEAELKRKQAAEREAKLQAEAEERQRREAEYLTKLREEQEAQRRIIQNQRVCESQARSNQIQQFCLSRNINTLVHFTRVENLASIFQHGLLGRKALLSIFSDVTYIFNDNKRIDCYEDAICLSISFPNYRMFYRYRQENPPARWAIILIKPEVLWELDCAFCHTNAASNLTRFIDLDERRSLKALERMYSDELAPRNQLRIPPSYTTDPQAEVLVFGGIPTNYITEINVSTDDARRYILKLSLENFCWRLDNRFFDSRTDWMHWQKSRNEILF